MARVAFDQSAREKLAQSISEIEKDTDAELVIVVRGRSASYRQVDYFCGALVALGGLLFLVFSPFTFHERWIPFDAVLLFVIAAWLSSRSATLHRLLTSEEFRAAAVRQGAAAMFYEAGIANTEAGMGILIYL